MNRKIIITISFSIFATLAGRAAERSFDQWADQFADEWVRAHPQLATRTQYFEGAEQDALDRQMTLSRGLKAAQGEAELARRGLKELKQFPDSRLTPSQRTSAAVIRWDLEMAVKDEKFARLQFIFDQFRGEHVTLVQFLTTLHPIRNARDAENYLARLHLLAPLLDEAIAEAQSAERAGILPPNFILRKSRAQIEKFTAPPAESNSLVTTFTERLAKLGERITESQRREFTDSAEKEVRDTILPAFGRVKVLLENQLPKATDEAGIGRLPQGKAAYRQLLATRTTTSLSPEKIHKIGLQEVEQSKSEMDGILRQLGYEKGTVEERLDKLNASLPLPSGPDSRETMLKRVAEIIQDAERRSVLAFDLRPKAPVVVRREPEMTEKTAAAHYTPPARDGSRPGIYWLPMADLSTHSDWVGVGTKTVAYHEAIPGHHFQVALQQELPDLPRYRKFRVFGFNSAYVEGWALYAEQLAVENGWYEGDLVGRLGALNAQLFRAKRLVVDTGLHAKKWTRQQVVDYGFSVQETERYIVLPGQACSYMIGRLRILELRERAKRKLSAKFDIKQFHNTILSVGCVPLEVLEQEVDNWIAARRKEVGQP